MSEKIPKIIAMYLPQYYQIPENDAWWGDGFTEWTNVRAAKSYFSGHIQPRIPAAENYYCTLNKETRKKQAQIAKEHGVYGFCYYHYWFGDNDLLLEKPTELLLTDGEPDMPFCFSWANESWARTWEGQPFEILKKQTYGDIDSWKKHFEYLLPFFKHPLYILEDGKPLFLVHYTVNMGSTLANEMFAYWNKLAIEAGFNGIYIVETLTGSQSEPISSVSSGVYQFEPHHTLRNMFSLKLLLNVLKHGVNRIWENVFRKGLFLNIVDYSEVWRLIQKKQQSVKVGQFGDKKYFLGAFVAWDNSPRKHKSGLIMTNSSPELFEKYLRNQIQFAQNNSINYLFVNAWNEWAEGAYLEPDTHFGFGYLNSVKNAQIPLNQK